MKVLQLIDSLNAGGAERVAVNYANSLVNYIETSYICSTRSEGVLKETILNEVKYLFLNRKLTLDFNAIKKLNSFIKENKIEIIHAHGSSYFIATIVRVLNPKLVLIWHEHYGNREKTSKVSKTVLKCCSYFFSCIITVNKLLQIRSESKLLVKAVYLLPNYPIISSNEGLNSITNLKGEKGKRIVCLANLRPDKDHLNLLKAFRIVLKSHKDWSLHLVGKLYENQYNETIKNFITDYSLKDDVFIYGSCSDVFSILKQSDIGVLSSKSEGLPMSLLEYGLSKLPVIATDVGDCRQVISNQEEGFLVKPQKSNDLANGMIKLIVSKGLRKSISNNLHSKVVSSFSEESSLVSLIRIYKKY